MKEVLENFKANDFIAELDSPLKEHLIVLESKGSSFRQIGNEIANIPITGIDVKSKKDWDKSIFEKILTELANIICKNKGDLGKDLKKNSQLTIQVVIGVVSAKVAEQIGFSYSLCVPFVVIGIATFLQSGINVFCAEYQS